MTNLSRRAGPTRPATRPPAGVPRALARACPAGLLTAALAAPIAAADTAIAATPGCHAFAVGDEVQDAC